MLNEQWRHFFDQPSLPLITSFQRFILTHHVDLGTAIMTVITNRINNLANIGCTVILTSCTVQEDDEKNELYRSWVQQMHGRVILRKEKGDVRTVCSSKVGQLMLDLVRTILWCLLF
ncbi:unnamed protein product [Cylicostephanus goldi]|uniref:Uncharacterized protein n=1 Tax=Cylicostephanus goldi TaxID=71465 RepID=A0A3P6S0B9_CYLGO|nr:unnamed protein product [Cylicostephanus goldi]